MVCIQKCLLVSIIYRCHIWLRIHLEIPRKAVTVIMCVWQVFKCPENKCYMFYNTEQNYLLQHLKQDVGVTYIDDYQQC